MGPAYFNKYILPAEDVIAEARTYASREDASPYARLLILALVEIVSRQREEERKEDTRVDESQPSANSPTGSTASGPELFPAAFDELCQRFGLGFDDALDALADAVRRDCDQQDHPAVKSLLASAEEQLRHASFNIFYASYKCSPQQAPEQAPK